MSKQEAVSAFLKGSIGRREFVQRLGIAGVSATAAVAYANALRPSGAAAAGNASGASGFRRAFQEDDYAGETEVPTEVPGTGGDDVVDAIGAVLATLIDGLSGIVDNATDILAELGITGPIADDFVDNITQLIANLQAHSDALGAAYVPGASGVRALQADVNSLAEMAEMLNDVAGGHAGLLLGSDDESVAKQLGPYAIVAGRHAAYLDTLLGNNPFQSAAEPVVSASEIGD